MSEALSNLSHEDRRFPPPKEFAADGQRQGRRLRRGRRRPAGVLGQAGRAADLGAEVDRGPRLVGQAVREVVHRRQAQRRLQLRRPARRGRPRRPGRLPLGGRARDDTRTITYAELKDEVCKAANALIELGVQTGDRVAIYMPMIPETVIAMLACARLGAPHTVVFGGFSSHRAVRPHHRLRRARGDHRRRRLPARRAVGAQAGGRRGAAEVSGRRASVLVVQAHRAGRRVDRRARRLVARPRRQAVDRARRYEAFDAEHPLYVMYTSGTTGKPKGILHTSGGYLTQVAYTH